MEVDDDVVDPIMREQPNVMLEDRPAGKLDHRLRSPFREGPQPGALTGGKQQCPHAVEVTTAGTRTPFQLRGSHPHREERRIVQTATFTRSFLDEAVAIIRDLDASAIDRVASILRATRDRGGRLFILGVGGSAGNASHAVNDFRKLCGIEAYAPTDNVSELTARTNDEGWPTVFEGWLKVSKLRADDTIMVFSVGGGSLEKNVSPNLVTALQLAKQVGSGIVGIVGRDGGYTATVADAAVIIPTVNPEHVTPHSEAFQAVVWHLLVTHPQLKANATKWESTK